MNELKELSSITLHEMNGGNALEVHISGKITSADYERLVPTVERLIKQHGKIRMLMEMHDFHGWTAGGLLQDIKFDARHFNDIERIAMVGEAKWQHGMSAFCKPFTRAKIRYYENVDEARAWLLAD